MAAGAALIGWGAVAIAREYPSTSWPSVKGKILSQQLEIFPPGGSHKRWHGAITLSYEYVVSGQTNQASQYSLPHRKFDAGQKMAEAFAKNHPRGAVVTVFYHPKHPEQAVLLIGPDWNVDCALIVVGMFAMFVGILTRILFKRLKRGQKVIKR